MNLAKDISERVSSLPPEKQEQVLDFVLSLEQTREAGVLGTSNDVEARRRRVTAALDALRRSGAFAHIADPVAWQREIRKDQPLPGRKD